MSSKDVKAALLLIGMILVLGAMIYCILMMIV